MAQLVLSTLGQALGARVGGSVLAFAGQALGSALGGAIDARVFGPSGARNAEGPRLTDLHLQGSTEGASIPALYGRTRIAGQVIWAARYKEHVETAETREGGKGGGARMSRTTSYRYTLSFAVGLCEGLVTRIGRVWANGAPLDLSRVAYRLHTGGEDQAPDPLIEAIEGAENAPAYRGLAYIVFEDLPLEEFGNAMPQLSFEVMRAAPGEGARLENLVEGVCLIPGAGEFVYATAPVRRVLGPGASIAENQHAEQARANFEVALDQLQADLPNCTSVLLVVAWFGTDLRAGHCQIKPGVEISEKETAPLTWRAGGADRAGAHLISQYDGGPAYGGTPSDDTVIAAIAALKARGFSVGLYPFVLMDVPHGNALPDPYGGAAQAAYPWRGRITLADPAHDKTSAATAQIAAFFGAAEPADFAIVSGAVSYSGPNEWSYRRFALHLAKLAEAAGGVDAFVLASELRGVTTARDSATSFPAVAHLQSLAADVRAVLPDATLTYAADWSEYRGHQPADGSGDVFFHLDPLWADANIDVVGIDYYAPLTDWRAGHTHADAALARRIHDPVYLASRIEAGEAYEWFYASDEDRSAQTRTPISDGSYGEPWIYRAKDVRAFWTRAHYNRPGGVRDVSPTAWAPQSKPIWFTELGCPAVNKGANAPNLFVDPKSAESSVPPFSTGARDDLIQRRTLEAYLSYWTGPANPTSTAYGAPMLAKSFVWAWDARPFPGFPARRDVWSDGPAWRLGHWLNGRAGLATLADVVADVCARAGVTDIDVSGLSGIVAGYVVDAPASARAALEPLMAAYAFNVREQDGTLVFAHTGDAGESHALTLDDLTATGAADLFRARADAAEAPIEARVRFLDTALDYRAGAASARRRDAAQGGVETIDAPLVLEPEAAEALAERLLSERRAARESGRIALGPAQLALEPGDQVTFAGETYQVARIEDGAARMLELTRVAEASPEVVAAPAPNVPTAPAHAVTPAFSILDLPPLNGFEDDTRPLAAVFASPWRAAHTIFAGADAAHATMRGTARDAAIMGELTWALWAGPVGRWDRGNVFRVKLYGGALESVSEEDVLNGANVFAVEGEDGAWEILQARTCELVGPNEYELSGLLRGLKDSRHAMGLPTPVGARFVKLDARLARLSMPAHEWRTPRAFIAPPAGAPATDAAAESATRTLAHVGARPFRPVHLRARRAPGGDVTLRWLRQTRAGGLYWGPGEPPLTEPAERYTVEILDGGGLVRRAVESSAPEWVYSAAAQSADFGALPANLRFRVGQIGADSMPGLKTEATIPL